MQDDYDLTKLRKKPKRKNSRSKGARFERKLCEILNEHFETTDFSRTPGSGAFASTHKLPEHLQIHGDLITPTNFAFTIEAKSGYNGCDLQGALSPKNDIYKFIKQAEDDAERAKKPYILLFRQDRRGILGIINKKNPLYKSLPDEIERIELIDGSIMLLFEELLKLPIGLFFDK